MSNLSNLLPSLGAYFLRDASYALAGGIVLGLVLEGQGKIDGVSDWGILRQAALLGLCYLVGFALQELATVARLVSMGYSFRVGRLRRWVFERTRDEGSGDRWKPVSDPSGLLKVHLSDDEKVRVWVDRIGSHRSLFSSCGAACLAGTAVSVFYCLGLTYYLSLGLGGLALVSLSWLKAMQEVEYLNLYLDELSGPPVPPDDASV